MSCFADPELNTGPAHQANPFTQYYGQLLHQGNMLQDYVRTGTYQHAVMANISDFKDKVVLDVGTGTGILSFFAAQAGAKKVYAVEASPSAKIAKLLSDHNGFSNIIEIVVGKIEEIDLPEKVDIIISEPIGFLLVHERMLESYVCARDRFLKPQGLMFPSTGSIVLAPFTDDVLYREQLAKSQFWENNNFYGVDLSPLVALSVDENFSQPVVGYVSTSNMLSSHRVVHTIDFSTVTCPELCNFSIDFSFRIDRTAILHGLAGWFDISFDGSTESVVLSTAPECPGTHWYQCRMLLRDPLAVNRGQYISGSLLFEVNEKFSYNITMNVQIEGTDIPIQSSNKIYLHDQVYHYLTSSSSAVDMNGNSHGQ